MLDFSGLIAYNIIKIKIREDTKMGYYVIDAMGNFICTEEREEVARQMAENLGGDYIEIE